MPSEGITTTTSKEKGITERDRGLGESKLGQSSGWRCVTVRVPWYTDVREFFYRFLSVLSQMSEFRDIEDADLWQPLYKPVHDFHYQHSRSGKTPEGKLVIVKISVFYQPELSPKVGKATVKGIVKKSPVKHEDDFGTNWFDIYGDPTVPGLVGQIFFPTNGAILDIEDKKTLDNLIVTYKKQIRQNGRIIMLTFAGHTDKRGTEKSNKLLGAGRANAVSQYIKPRLAGIKPSPGRSLLSPDFNYHYSKAVSFGELEAGERESPDIQASERRVDIYSYFVKERPGDVLDSDDEHRLGLNLKRIKRILVVQDTSVHINRLKCIMNKIQDKSVSDEYFDSPLWYLYSEKCTPLSDGVFAIFVKHLRKNLSSWYYILTERDSSILSTLIEIDKGMWWDIQKIRSHKTTHGGATCIRMLQLGEWIRKRQAEEEGIKSIYSCYK